MGVSLAGIPRVDLLLDRPQIAALGWRRDIKRAAIDSVLSEIRQLAKEKPDSAIPEVRAIEGRVVERLAEWMRVGPRPVVNATGVLLHTNLGRAPLSERAISAALAAAGHCDLELELETGTRASRLRNVTPLLCALSGAEAAHVVNNGAAAVLLAATALAPSGLVISRGQLVEIGDGFRIAEMAGAAGAKIMEVGSTNRTHADDYEAAIQSAGIRGCAILWVHRSNFVQRGYVADVEIADLVKIASIHDIPLIADLGSGGFDEMATPGEPTVSSCIRAGATLVICSGDKLLGGPQSGLMLGRSDVIEAVRRHPMARALRIDKLCLAALHATLIDQAMEVSDTGRLARRASTSAADLHQRAAAIIAAVGEGLQIRVVTSQATWGGGALPESCIESVALVLGSSGAEAIVAELRRASPPVVGRVVAGEVWLDLRTVASSEDGAVIAALRGCVMAH